VAGQMAERNISPDIQDGDKKNFSLKDKDLSLALSALGGKSVKYNLIDQVMDEDEEFQVFKRLFHPRYPDITPPSSFKKSTIPTLAASAAAKAGQVVAKESSPSFQDSDRNMSALEDEVVPVAAEQRARKDIGPESQDYDRKLPALEEGTMGRTSIFDSQKEGLLLPVRETRRSPKRSPPRHASGAVFVRNPYYAKSERCTTYVTNAVLVETFSSDKKKCLEETKLGKTFLFGGLMLGVVIIVIGIVLGFRESEVIQNEKLKAAVEAWTENRDDAENLYGPIGEWSTSEVTSFHRLFYNKKEFSEDLTEWDSGKVTTMSIMFRYATSFNGDVSTFDTSVVTSMIGMFSFASFFNMDVSSFDTSQVISMTEMFSSALSFNQCLKWDLSNKVDTSYMFEGSSGRLC